MFFPYIFTEWHIVPLLYIQIKLERACSRKTLAEGKASRRLGKYIGGFVCFCESPAIISNISSIRIRFLIREDGARRPLSYYIITFGYTLLSPLFYFIIATGSVVMAKFMWVCFEGL